MKKIFFTLAALVLAFTGCSQEEDAIQVSEKKAIKVVVNMDKPGFGEDTRAPRTEWVAGDQVVVALFNDSEIYKNACIKLIYTIIEGKGAWTTVFWENGANTSSSVFINNLIDKFAVDGDVKAAYFSSGIHSLTFEESAMDITTFASLDKKGECIMTCEDGTYKFEGTADEYVLTLNITMKPQVAQFTIKDLDIADDWNVYAEGPFNLYAGGTITSAGVELTPLSEGVFVYCYDNEDGISFYVAPWQSEADMPDDYDGEYSANYLFNVYNDDVDTERTFPFTQVAIGGAVIFDGPTTDASKWEFY